MTITAGALIAFGFAGLFQVLVVLLVLEGYLLWTAQPPITWYLRRAEWAFPGPAVMAIVAVAFMVGSLFAHFVWDARKDKPIDPPTR